jgi:uncharacterized protein (DUF1810 family)
MDDPYDLARFVAAQEPVYAQALDELRRGRKQSHWMWFIFPQLAGLGLSATSRHFAIRSRAEARFYLDHPLLGSRLRQCTEAVLAHSGEPAKLIFGGVDAAKFRSSMTLFAAASEAEGRFTAALNAFFAGEHDPATLRLLG